MSVMFQLTVSLPLSKLSNSYKQAYKQGMQALHAKSHVSRDGFEISRTGRGTGMVLVLVLYKCTRTLYEYRLRFRPGSGVPLAHQLAHQDIRCRGGTRGRGLITSTRTVRVLYRSVSLQNFVSGYIPEFQILYGNIR